MGRADLAGPQAFGPDIRTALFEVLGLVLSLATLAVAILHLRIKRRPGPDTESNPSHGHELNELHSAVMSVQGDDRLPTPEEVTPADD